MKFKRKAALIAAVTAVLIFAAGCGDSHQTQTSGEKVKWWIPLESGAATVMKSFGESRLAQSLIEETGIDIEFIHPPQGQDSEKFNLLTASDDLPDIITYNWRKYPGGPQKAIREKVILDLNQHKNKIPNLMKYMDENPEMRKLASTDEGQLFSFPFIRGEDELCVSDGLIIRQDWLEDLNLEMPKTIADWEKVLTAFKTRKGAASPFCSTNIYLFAGAYNTSSGFYIDNGTVKYGPLEPAYKEFITTMNRWYKNGLIDADFATRNRQATQSNMLNGVSGVTNGSIGSGIGAMMTAAGGIEGFDLAGAPFPTLDGGKPEFGVYQIPAFAGIMSHSAVTTTCKNLDSVFKLLDYGYSEEGHMLYNFGVEGESYEMVDGYPKYTDFITNNSDGLSMTAAMSKYMLSYASGPFIQDIRYMEQYAALPQQKEAWKVWSDTNMRAHQVPNLYMQDDELVRYAELSNSVVNRADEITLKLIIGTESLDNYDNLVAELHARGADELIAMQQAAYERYLAR